MRLLHVIDTGGLGGAERVFVELVSGLDPSRYEPVVAVPGTQWLHDRLTERGLQPLRIGSPRRFDLGLLAQLRRIVRSQRVDLVHTHLLTTAVYASAAVGVTGTPVIATFHGLDDIPASDRLGWLKCRIINRGVRRIVFVSEALRRAMLQRTSLDGRLGTVVHNGIDLDRFRPGRDSGVRRELGVADHEFLVGAVGNYSAAKGYEVLVQAAARLAQSGEATYRFVVVGRAPPPPSKVPALIERHGLAGVVRFIGPRDDVARLLRGFDAFALPSHSEGFSLSTVEAMASGVPVVATRSGGPEEIVVDGQTGLLVDVNAPDQLAEALARLRADGGLRQALAQRASHHAAARFSVRAMVAAYQRLYDALGGGADRGERPM